MKLTRKLKICLVLLLTLSFVPAAAAAPGKYVNLTKGQIIPWTGWCFDSEAMASMIAEKEVAEQRCELRVMHELEQQQAKFDLQLGQLEASMQYEVQTRDVAIQALQEENLKIEQALIHDQKFGWIAPASLGLVIGALTMFLVAL